MDSIGVRVVSLSCPGCGAALEVGPALTQLACGYCGKVATVERSGGTIALLPMVAAIERVQVGTDRTAAELAMVRLKAELAMAEANWYAANADWVARNPVTSGWSGLFSWSLIVSTAGVICSLGVLLRIATGQNNSEAWAWLFLVALVSAGALFATKVSKKNSKRFADARQKRYTAFWAPHGARIEWLKSQIEKNRAIVDG